MVGRSGPLQSQAAAIKGNLALAPLLTFVNCCRASAGQPVAAAAAAAAAAASTACARGAHPSGGPAAQGTPRRRRPAGPPAVAAHGCAAQWHGAPVQRAVVRRVAGGRAGRAAAADARAQRAARCVSPGGLRVDVHVAGVSTARMSKPLISLLSWCDDGVIRTRRWRGRWARAAAVAACARITAAWRATAQALPSSNQGRKHSRSGLITHFTSCRGGGGGTDADIFPGTLCRCIVHPSRQL